MGTADVSSDPIQNDSQSNNHTKHPDPENFSRSPDPNPPPRFPPTVPIQTAIFPCDDAAVPDLLDRIQVTGQDYTTNHLRHDDTDRNQKNSTRLTLLSHARALVRALETPRETMIKHCWAEPSAAMCLAVGVDTGLFHYLSCNDAGCPYPTRRTPPTESTPANPKSLTTLSNLTGIAPTLLSRLLRHLTSTRHILQPTPQTFLPTTFSASLTHPTISDGYPVIHASTLPALSHFPVYAKRTAYREPCDPENGPYQFGIREEALGVGSGDGEEVRIERMGCDFFKENPVQGASAYYLHSVLHDWPNPLAATILSRIAQAMKPGYSKLLINENCIPDQGGAHSEATALDMMMLGLVASKERTEYEWRELIEGTVRADGFGLKVVGIWGGGEQEGVESLIECGYGHNLHPDETDPNNPFMDPRSRSPERYHSPSYQLDDRPYVHEDAPLEIPVGPGPFASTDRLQPQPTYSVENIPGSYGHAEAYEDVHQHAYTPNPFQQTEMHGTGEYSLTPQYEHTQDHLYAQPPTPLPGVHVQDHAGFAGFEQPQHPYYQDDADHMRLMLQADTAYGPNPDDVGGPPQDASEDIGDIEGGYSDAQQRPAAAPIRRWKTVKEVQLFNGNLVLDCPIPPRLLNQVAHAQPPERDEFTHMRYSAATCDPSEFYDKRFTLRQRLFAKPRHTELFIVITMYNEEDELFARTMIGVIK
ncbi:Chitin synthase, partial [Hortaea werneckii]